MPQDAFRERFRTKQRFFLILLLASILIAPLLSVVIFNLSRRSLCEPIVASRIYTIIQTYRGISNFNFHGYKRVRICRQDFYRSIRAQGETNCTPRAEDYAKSMWKKYGSGYLDFQFPDSAFQAIDFGFTTFPSKFDCTASPLNSSVYLSTMITVDGFRVALVNSFIDYYRKIGIEVRNILITVQMTRESKLDHVVNVLDILKSKGVYYDILVGEWSSESLMFHQAHKLLHCTRPNDWIIVADSDEFHEYPTKDVKVFLKKLDFRNINIVNGIFLDRVSINGSLEELYYDSHIFEEFPLGCQLHRSFSLGTPKKVMAFKGYLRINRGHHRIALCWFWNRRNYLDLTPWDSCPPKILVELKSYARRLNVHHFKWMKGQYEATQHKAKVWANTSVGKSYHNVLKHLEQCGGICVRNPKIECSRQI